MTLLSSVNICYTVTYGSFLSNFVEVLRDWFLHLQSVLIFKSCTYREDLSERARDRMT